MSFDDVHSCGGTPIPNLRPWFETAAYDDHGRTLVPSNLAYQCELSYALDHDFSCLKYVKCHIYNNGFGFEGGHFHNAYDKVKDDMAFAHEIVHLWANIWGTMDGFEPMLYRPFYDGNGHAKALVIPMQEDIQNILWNDFDSIGANSYVSKVTWDHQRRIKNLQKWRNFAAIDVIHSGQAISVYDWMRIHKLHQRYPTPTEAVSTTRLGERLIDPMDAQTLVIPDKTARAFYDVCIPLVESLILTRNELHSELGLRAKSLSNRTIDMMLRGLKVREFYDIMHDGQARVMSVSHKGVLRRIEQEQIRIAEQKRSVTHSNKLVP